MFPNKDCVDCPPCPPVIPAVPIPDLSHVCGGEYDLSCVRYTGPNIACLEIFSGTMMSEVLAKFNTALAACNCCYVPPPVPINCVVGNWSEWSTPCTCVTAGPVTTCTQKRTRIVLIPAENGGTPCPVLEETRCCPVNCSGAYTYTNCATNGTRTGTFIIATQPNCGGTPCPPTTITESCIPNIDCVKVWSEWSTCIANSQKRTATITTPSSGTGQVCGPLEETRSCVSDPPDLTCEPVSSAAVGIVYDPALQQYYINYGYRLAPLATNYDIFYTKDNGASYSKVTTTEPGIRVYYNSTTDCSKIYKAYVITNCPNGGVSLQVPFPDVIIPPCPPPDPCSGNYQALITGSNSTSLTSLVVKKISNLGIYDPTDFASILSVSGGNILTSALSLTGFYIGGRFNKIGGVARQSIAKLMCNSTLDPSFIVGSGFSSNYTGDGVGRVNIVVLDAANDRLYVGGDFSIYNGAARNNFAVLKASTGAVLPLSEFNMGSGFQKSSATGAIPVAHVLTIALHPTNGSILVGGYFLSYNGAVANNIIRLLPNGNRDPSFNADVFSPFSSAGYTYVQDIAVDTDDKIFVVGSFAKYGTSDSVGLVKLLSSGAKDPAFNVGQKINAGPNITLGGVDVYKVLIQNANHIIISGDFTKYETTITNSLMRLDKFNGNLDPNYTKDGATVLTLNDMNSFRILKKTPDGNIILAGFTTTSYFQGLADRKHYYILNGNTLAVDLLLTKTPSPMDYVVTDVMIKHTP